MQLLLRTQCGHGSWSQRLADGVVKTLPAPKAGSQITYDDGVKGFGVTDHRSRRPILHSQLPHAIGRERRYTIGNFPDWKTAAARAEAAELKKQIDGGGDPLGDVQLAARRRPLAICATALLPNIFHASDPRRKRATCNRSRVKSRPALGRLKVAKSLSPTSTVCIAPSASEAAPIGQIGAFRCLAVCSRVDTLGNAYRQSLSGHRAESEFKRRRYLSAEELSRLTIALTSCRISSLRHHPNVVANRR